MNHKNIKKMCFIFFKKAQNDPFSFLLEDDEDDDEFILDFIRPLDSTESAVSSTEPDGTEPDAVSSTELDSTESDAVSSTESDGPWPRGHGNHIPAERIPFTVEGLERLRNAKGPIRDLNGNFHVPEEFTYSYLSSKNKLSDEEVEWWAKHDPSMFDIFDPIDYGKVSEDQFDIIMANLPKDYTRGNGRTRQADRVSYHMGMMTTSEDLLLSLVGESTEIDLQLLTSRTLPESVVDKIRSAVYNKTYPRPPYMQPIDKADDMKDLKSILGKGRTLAGHVPPSLNRPSDNSWGKRFDNWRFPKGQTPADTVSENKERYDWKQIYQGARRKI